MQHSEEPRASQAQVVFEAWLHAKDSGADLDWSDLVATHAPLAEELERLRVDYDRAAEALGRLAAEPPDSRSLRDPDHLATLFDELARPRDSRSYTPLGTIARGGMGLVERVWDDRLQRVLARKVVAIPIRGKHTASERRRLTRFMQEARVSSQLQHPGILAVHDIGVDESGFPFFTMPVVRGQHLGNVIRETHRGQGTWTMTSVLHVLARVCDVLSYAHEQGVVHRDLKPENVMVGPFGETFVMDWGIAKVDRRAAGTNGPSRPSAESELLAERADRLYDTPFEPTRTGDVVGTPSYMPPEQASGATGGAEPGVDQYSIGAILYELLTNRRPYSDTPDSDTLQKMIAQVRRAPPTAPQQLAPHAAPELVAICEKAMQRDPGLRYGSVAELGADLRAFLEQRVVGAYDTGAIASLGKWIRRNRVVAGLVLLLALLVGGSLAVFLALETQRSRRLTDANLDLERTRRELDVQVDALRREAYLNELGFVQRTMAAGIDGGQVQRALDGCDEDLRGWEWKFLRSQADQSTHVSSESGALAISADGRLVASCTRDYVAVVREVATGAERGRVACRAMIDSLAFSPDNAWLAVAARDQLVYVLELRTGALREVFAGAGQFNVVTFTQDSTRVCLRQRGSGTFSSFDPRTGEPGAKLVLSKGVLTAIATHDSGRVAVGDDRGVVRVLASVDEQPLHEWQVSSVGIDSLGFRGADEVVAVDYGGVVWVRGLDGAELRRIPPRGKHSRRAIETAVDPSGRRVVKSFATSIDLLDVDSGTWRTLQGHTGRILALAFTSNGRLASTSEDGSTRLWSATSAGAAERFDVLGGSVHALSVAPDNSSVVVSVGDYLVRLSLDGGERRDARALVNGIRRLRHSVDGSRVVVVGKTRALRLYSAADLHLEQSLFVEVAESSVLEFAPDGRLLSGADASSWDNMNLWDLRPGGGTHPFSVAYSALDGCFSPDGRSFALAGDDGALHIFDTASLVEQKRIVLSDLRLNSVAWSPDGERIAVGGYTARQGWPIFLVDPVQGVIAGELKGPTSASDLEFTPDGRLLSMQGGIRVWDVERERTLLAIEPEGARFGIAMDLSPDGTVLALGTSSGHVFVWRIHR